MSLIVKARVSVESLPELIAKWLKGSVFDIGCYLGDKLHSALLGVYLIMTEVCFHLCHLPCGVAARFVAYCPAYFVSFVVE